MDRSCPSTASVLLEEARVLPEHYIWFDFYLDLFIHQFFWLWHGALLHTSPFFFFFSPHCQCQRSTTESKNDGVHGNQIQLTQGEVRGSQLSGTVCTCMCGRDWGDGASLLSHRGREPQVPSQNILTQLFHQQEYH